MAQNNAPSKEEIRLRILEVLIPISNARAVTNERIITAKASALEYYVQNGYPQSEKDAKKLQEMLDLVEQVSNPAAKGS